MTLDSNVLPVVDERMIDILLLEMFHTDAGFRDWAFGIIGRAGGPPLSLVSARHSVFESSSGETDIEVVCEEANGFRIGFLIENKVYAHFMPRQLERYRMRGEEGRLAGRWDSFRVILVAPQQYLSGLPADQRQHLDAELPYEAILAWLEAEGREQLSFKRYMLERGVASGRKGYVKQPDAAMTKFWRDYWEWLRSSGSKLAMAEPHLKGRDSSWIDFTVPWQAPKCKLYHKFKKGSVELVVESRDAERAEAFLGSILGEGMIFVPTKSTASVCIDVPMVDHRFEFSAVEQQISRAVMEAERLQALAVSPEFKEAVAGMLDPQRSATTISRNEQDRLMAEIYQDFEEIGHFERDLGEP